MWSIEAIQIELLKVSKVAHIEVSKAPLLNEELAASKRSDLLLKNPSLVEKVLQTAEDFVEFDPPLKRVLARWLAGDGDGVGGEMIVMKLPQVMMGHSLSVFNGIPTEVVFSSLLFCCCWF